MQKSFPVLPVLTLFVLISLFLPNNLIAQQTDQPGTIVFSQNKCPSENLPELNQLQDSLITPVMDELVDEGLILGWGILTHSWGDEWNWNVYYSVESHRAFLDFWSELMSRMNERHPGWFERLAPLCTEHKDNIYNVRTAYPE